MRGGVRHTLRRWPALVWLWLLWVLLWGTPNPLVLAGGLLVAATVVFAFPMPAITPRVTARPWQLIRLLGYLLADLVVSSTIVAWNAVRHGPRTPAAVVEVPLRVDSDLLITATVHLTTVSPGTLVLEIDRGQRLLYVHTLPVHGAEEAGHRRSEVQEAELRVVRALGSAEAVRALENPEEETG